MASLFLKGIYKVYPSGVTAVTDFNLEIKDKEFIMLDPDTSRKSKKKIKQMNKNSNTHKSADAPNEETRQEVLSETPVMGSESLENTEVIKEEDSEK